MKPRPGTALQNWMRENLYSDAALASEITARLPAGKSIGRQSVMRWRLGARVPRKPAMRILTEMSGGIVDANSFVEAVSSAEVGR